MAYRDLLEGVQAVGEPLLTMASGTLAEPISGLYGLATQDPDAVERVHDKLTYQPQTIPGQVGLQAIGEASGGLGHALESITPIGAAVHGYNKLTESVGEKSPLAGALMTAAPTAALIMAAPEARQAISEFPGAVGRTALEMATEGPASGSLEAQRGAFRPGVVVPAIKTAVTDAGQAARSSRAALGALASRQASALKAGASEINAARIGHTAETIHKTEQASHQSHEQGEKYRDLLE